MKQEKLPALFFFLPAAAYYALVFYFSSRPLYIPVSFSWVDKVGHVLEFSGLGWLLSFGFVRGLGISQKKKFALALVAGILLGVSDELHQLFVPGRQSDPWDVLADSIGILAAVWGYSILSRIPAFRFLKGQKGSPSSVD